MSNQGTSKGGASATTSTSTPAAPPTLVPTPLDCSKANTGVWLVKVPKYLARKWIDAPENSEVGVIRITQSKFALLHLFLISIKLNDVFKDYQTHRSQNKK